MKVRNDKSGKAAGRALLIDGRYLPRQQALMGTRRESGALNLLLSHPVTLGT